MDGEKITVGVHLFGGWKIAAGIRRGNGGLFINKRVC